MEGDEAVREWVSSPEITNGPLTTDFSVLD